MKYPKGSGARRNETRRSNRSAINPYLIEDVAMTRGELERVRSRRAGLHRCPIEGMMPARRGRQRRR